MKHNWFEKFDDAIRNYRHSMRRYQITGSKGDLIAARNHLIRIMKTAKYVLPRIDEFKKEKALDTATIDKLLNLDGKKKK